MFSTTDREWQRPLEDENPEVVQWLFPSDLMIPDQLMLLSWIKCGPRKQTLDLDDVIFGDETMVDNIYRMKNKLDNYEDREKSSARKRSNPYEMIGKNIFMNRAAVKMANLDSLFENMLTDPIDQFGNSLLEDDLLYFVDMFGGPGGCSEYVLWRKKWQSKGFGFTTKGDYEFDLNKFVAGYPEYFYPFYGSRNNASIQDPENIIDFVNFVKLQTNNIGVHLFMCDGGFLIKHNGQELLSKNLYISLMTVALMVVQENGHAIIKMFDVFTKFSIGLIYLMHLCFDRICITKPHSSR